MPSDNLVELVDRPSSGPKLARGSIVAYHSVIGGPVTSYGHVVLELGVLPSGHNVAWITNKTGCVAVEALSIPAWGCCEQVDGISHRPNCYSGEKERVIPTISHSWTAVARQCGKNRLVADGVNRELKGYKHMKIKTVKPQGIGLCPKITKCIEFKPHVLNYVGIGWVDEGEAELSDFKKYPVVVRPWLNTKELR